MITFDPAKPSPVPVTLLPDGATFVLDADLAVNVGTQGAPIVVAIKKGFQTDLASIPGWAGILGFDKLGKHSTAAILHDWLFVTQAVGFEGANAIFYEFMRRLGVGRVRASLMSFAVQLAGKKLYKRAPQRWRDDQPMLAASVLGMEDDDHGHA